MRKLRRMPPWAALAAALLVWAGATRLGAEPPIDLPLLGVSEDRAPAFDCAYPTSVGEAARGGLSIEELRARGNLIKAAEEDAGVVLPQRVVRFAYLIPADKAPQPNGVANLQRGILRVAWWYGEQMERWGYGRRSFVYETEPDGRTPKIHVLYSASASVSNDVVSASEEAQNLGATTWADGHAWLIVNETQILAPDGSLANTRYNGQSQQFLYPAVTGDQSGVALVTADVLAFMAPEFLENEAPYDGVVLPDLGPHPLKLGRTYSADYGSTLSELHSFALGVTAHELGHAFGLHHSFINTETFNMAGARKPRQMDVMGTGSIAPIGMRGNLLPSHYPAENLVLWRGAAMALSVNRWFNPGATYSDDVPPGVAPHPVEAPIGGEPGNGEMHFTAWDEGQLAFAWLSVSATSGDAPSVSQTELEGAASNGFLYLNFPVAVGGLEVFDAQGNKACGNDLAYYASYPNAPPPPRLVVLATPSTVRVGEPVLLDATRSSDSQEPIELATIEWDVDGDGLFDTTATPEKTYQASYQVPGVYWTRARVVGASGSVALSEPVAVRVLPPSPSGFAAR